MNKTEWTLLVLALALVAAAGLRPSIRGNDGVGHYVYLAALLRGEGLDFTNAYREFDALHHYPYIKFSDLARSKQTGRPSNRYGIGASCFWAPFVLAVHGALKLAGSPQANALGRPYEWAVGIGTAFWGSLGLALLYWRLRRSAAPLACAAVLAGLIFATPLGFYLYAHGSMSHGVGFFVAAALLLAFERAWQRPSPAALAGVGFWMAWLMMCRFQDATWVLVLGAAVGLRIADCGLRIKRSAECGARSAENKHGMMRSFTALRAPRSAFALVFAFFAVFSLQMAVWKVLYGSWFSGPMPYLDSTAGHFERWPIHILEALVSGRKGVLAWHPLIAIGLVGLFMIANCGLRNRRLRIADCGLRIEENLNPQSAIRNPQSSYLAWVGLIGFAAQLWLVGSWSMWWAGASFGNRFFISSLPFIALGLGRIAESLTTRRRRVIALAGLGLLIVWNMGLLIQYATEMLPREDWVSWSRIIRQNIIDVPGLLLRHLHR